jgi:hypothetical protein
MNAESVEFLEDQPAVAPAGGATVVAAAEMNPVYNILTLVLCGITSEVSRQMFTHVEDLNTINVFATLNGDFDVSAMAKRMASCMAAAGCVILGTMQITKIQASVFWVKDHHKRNLEVDPEMWTAEEVGATIQRKEAEQTQLQEN